MSLSSHGAVTVQAAVVKAPFWGAVGEYFERGLCRPTRSHKSNLCTTCTHG